MNRLRDEGFFEATIPAPAEAPGYRVEVVTYEGERETLSIVCLPPVLTDYDLYLFEGRHGELREARRAPARSGRGGRCVRRGRLTPTA